MAQKRKAAAHGLTLLGVSVSLDSGLPYFPSCEGPSVGITDIKTGIHLSSLL